jgi:ComF family protein
MWKLLFPPRCIACDRRLSDPIHPLCPFCSESLLPLGPACPRCAEPYSWPPSRLCRRCRKKPPPFAAVVAPFRYGGELATALLRLKFERRADIARSLAPLLQPSLAALAERIDLAIAVPLSRRRLAERGFNQAERLLVHAARGLGLPVARGCLERQAAGPAQSDLPAQARWANVARAFEVAGRRVAQLRGRRVLLVDDIVTTGATLAAASVALHRAGAAVVIGYCVARAEPP